MRTVDRSSLPTPSALADTTALARHAADYQASGKKPRDGVYRHESVVLALKSLFLNKCSLCECDAEHDGEVEHFIPHCPTRAELAYQWSNLHWTCGGCNARKRRDEYKEKDPRTGVVQRTKLIDPSNPHGGRAEVMLHFNSRQRAEPTPHFAGDEVVRLTANFLNSDPAPTERRRVYTDMSDAIAIWGSLPKWKSLAASGDQADWPDDAAAATACEHADRLVINFLMDAIPYCTSLRSALAERLGISFDQVARLGRWHRQRAGLNIIY